LAVWTNVLATPHSLGNPLLFAGFPD
jgi:hypothetical protein